MSPSALQASRRAFAGTRNPCRLCAPFGACVAFRGMSGTMVLLHGSQGCATYARRYLISHFREPVDIASSSFSEASAIFGGRDNLLLGLQNVVKQYRPEAVGIATTCLSETMGEDLQLLLSDVRERWADDALPYLIPVSTPAYNGTHVTGFHAAVRAALRTMSEAPSRPGTHVNLLPGMVSPADLRHLRSLCRALGLEAAIIPDISDTLDGGAWDEYHALAPGGTPLQDLRRAGSACATVDCTSAEQAVSGSAYLQSQYGVPVHRTGLPIGVECTDYFMETLSTLAGRTVPDEISAERGRLIDSYVDAHKYLYGCRVAVIGDEELTLALTRFLREVGMQPVLCATGAETKSFRRMIGHVTGELDEPPVVLNDTDFAEINTTLKRLDVDLIVASSKAYKTARLLDRPLVRVGFPIHDRFGAARLLHVGYRGTQQLLDRIVNALLTVRQDDSPVGYSYL